MERLIEAVRTYEQRQRPRENMVHIHDMDMYDTGFACDMFINNILRFNIEEMAQMMKQGTSNIDTEIKLLKKQLKHAKSYNAEKDMSHKLNDLYKEKSRLRHEEIRKRHESEHALDDFLGSFKIT